MRILCFILILLVLTLNNNVNSLSRMLRRGMYGHLKPPPSTLTDSDPPLPPDQWFSQNLDHFDPTNNQTWQQRYQVSWDYFTEGGPVFLMLGGEGAASPVWLVKGNWVNYAKQYNALMIQLEHRFYGESHPRSDLTVDSLKYLSSEQALADAAVFISSISDEYKLSPGTKWIVFGGSYSGNLAAWLRAKYPHLVQGAMSASGPVLAKVDFFEYVDVMKSSLMTYGESCTEAVIKGNRGVNKLLRHTAGQKRIDKLFRLCDPIDTTNKNDVINLVESLADNLAGVIQYNKDNREFRSSTWNITIDTVCGIMTNSTLGKPVDRYAAVNSLLLDAYEADCLDYKYDVMIDQLRNTSWPSIAGSFGERQWMYQTCTEFGFYQTSERKDQLFNNYFSLDFFLQQCSDIFGMTFSEEDIYAGVNRTNIMYGGEDIQASRVVYVHGSIDPWHALGITYTRIPESPAIFINGTAHCANMYPPSDSDLPALKAARQMVEVLIGLWLS